VTLRVAAPLLFGLFAATLGAQRPETPSINALIREHSPYLRSAANSPIDWRPWGESALAHARAQDRLIFVSIGYSSCHWCHVMARESFDDAGIAEVLNRGYVSLKIDSEERPDVDERFLVRLEALGIAAGWPMNFVLTSDLKVIWGSTYVRRDDLLATLERNAPGDRGSGRVRAPARSCCS
jgi:uncharacterized protein